MTPISEQSEDRKCLGEAALSEAWRETISAFTTWGQDLSSCCIPNKRFLQPERFLTIAADDRGRKEACSNDFCGPDQHDLSSFTTSSTKCTYSISPSQRPEQLFWFLWFRRLLKCFYEDWTGRGNHDAQWVTDIYKGHEQSNKKKKKMWLFKNVTSFHFWPLTMGIMAA